MNQVKVAMNEARYELGRARPSTGLLRITVEQHFRFFYIFDTADVWTADGWLVTAVQNDGVTHHVRKGQQVGTIELTRDTVLAYKPNAKTKHYADVLAAN